MNTLCRAGTHRDKITAIFRLCAAAAFVSTLYTAPAAAESDDASENDIELCLMIGIDASESIDPQEWHLQTHGLADAFQHRAVRGAVDSRGSIAVMTFTYGNGAVHFDPQWHVLSTSDDNNELANQFAFRARTAYADQYGETTILGSMNAALDTMESCTNPDADKVLYMMGDGADEQALMNPYRHNSHDAYLQDLEDHIRDMEDFHGRAAAMDVTVNGSSFGSDSVDEYYQNNIISRHGHSFPTRSAAEMLSATGDGHFSDIENAIILQTVRDLSFLAPQYRPAALPRPA